MQTRIACICPDSSISMSDVGFGSVMSAPFGNGCVGTSILSRKRADTLTQKCRAPRRLLSQPAVPVRLPTPFSSPVLSQSCTGFPVGAAGVGGLFFNHH